jgi:hypothetical protein
MKAAISHLIRLGMVLLICSANLSFAGMRWCALGVESAACGEATSCCQHKADREAPASDEGSCCCTELPMQFPLTLSDRASEESPVAATILPDGPASLCGAHHVTTPRTDSTPPVLRRYLRNCALLL